jgi:multidrug efflux pump subunit AcrB
MKLAEFSVLRPQFVVVLCVMFIALGGYAVMSMPRSEDPVFPTAGFSVVAVFPGAEPSTIEELVVDPIEDRLSSLTEIKSIRSTVEDGVAVIFVEGESSVDPDTKYDEVLREVDAARPEMPDSLLSLTVERWSTTNVAILEAALVSSSKSVFELKEIADRFEKRARTLPGVKEVSIFGASNRELRVELDGAQLSTLGLSLDRVLSAIAADNVTIPGGRVDAGTRSFNIKTGGGFASEEELRNAVVAKGKDGLIRFKDIATVGFVQADDTHLTRFNGDRCLLITVEQKDKENIFDVRDRVLAEIERFQKELPSGVRLVVGFDQSMNVKHRLGGLLKDFGIAMLLVLVTLLPLGGRAALIVMISIPLSLAIGLVLLFAAGQSINQISIVGFVIALGLLVDDSIVVTENVTRFIRNGVPRKTAAVEASRQIGLAVLGCTATLVFAFLPLLFLPGDPGKFILSMPLAVVFTVLASLVVSLSVIPFLASVILPSSPKENRVYNVFHGGIERVYGPVLRAALAHPLWTLVLTAALVVGSAMLVPRIGFSLFPKAGIPEFRVTVETPKGSSLKETDRAVRFAERVLRGKSEVVAVFANAGAGNPQVYYNVVPAREQPNIGELFVRLKNYDNKTPALLNRLRTELAEYPGASIEVREFENGPPIDAPIAVRIFADDLEMLKQQAAEVEAELSKTQGTIYVKNQLRLDRTDLSVTVDASLAGLYGVPVGEAERTVRMAIAGLKAGEIRMPDGDSYDITVTMKRGLRPSLDSLLGLSVTAITGAMVPLDQIARVGFTSSPSSIQHRNKERVAVVSAYVKDGFNTDRVTKQVLAKLASRQWPKGVRHEAAGEIESREESFGGLGGAILIAVFGILSILVLEFGNFRSTLIVASVVPLGLMGGLIALFLGGYTLSFTAMVGFTALIGIEVKNSILLVDFTNQLRADGVPLDEAIDQAGRTRFFPVLLTTMTAVGGLLPLAVSGSALYSPLALVIIGGLISSTVLARLVTPVLYKLMAPKVLAV